MKLHNRLHTGEMLKRKRDFFLNLIEEIIIQLYLIISYVCKSFILIDLFASYKTKEIIYSVQLIDSSKQISQQP